MMLSQPAWAFSSEIMYSECSKWKEIGFSKTGEFDDDGISAMRCAVYMQAISQVGRQNCGLPNHSGFQFRATPAQLAQAFLNVAEDNPQDWDLMPYSILISEFGKFPCEE
jgi:hypothetical protein